MTLRVFGLAATLAASAVAAQRPVPAGAAAENYDSVFFQLQTMAPRADRVAVVKDLTLRRDALVLHLIGGEVYLSTPVAGRTIGAVFVGRGTVSYAPPIAIERGELQRLLGDSLVQDSITSLVLVFTDSTLVQLERAATFVPGDRGDAARDALHEAVEWLVDRQSHEVNPPTLMLDLLNGSSFGFYYAHVKRDHGEDLTWLIDPEQEEQVEVLRKGRGAGRRTEIVNQYSRRDSLRDSAAALERPGGAIQLKAVGIDATIARGLGFSAKVTVHLAARRAGASWIRLLLHPEFQVDSIQEIDRQARRPVYYRSKQSSELWLRLDPPPGPGESRTLRVVYHGDLIGYLSMLQEFKREAQDIVPLRLQNNLPAALDKWLYVNESQLWFPRFAPADERYADLPAADVDLTFHAPKKYHLASVGRLVDTRVDADVQTTHWVTERPAGQVCFNLGEFEELTITDPRFPPVTLHTNAEGHRLLNQLLIGQNDPQPEVAHDVANSLAFFTEVYGTPLFPHYYATEIPFAYGQAFPGLMYLSFGTFESVSGSGNNESFRAHEMAHQWWGVGVEPAGYRDAWLSEGFADFSGLWYMQVRLNDMEKYYKQLRTWRTALLGRRDAAPPVGLGWRVGQLASDHDDYSLIIYKKGAWVLNMLRGLMRDQHTMSDSVFISTMQDFYRTYRGHLASTTEFQHVVEQHMGQPMGWFFNEWLEGTALPTYTLSWRSDATTDGHFLLRVRVRQERVPPHFEMPVPLEIHLGGSQVVFVRIDVTGPVTEASMRLPGEPTQLELAPQETVLAELKTEAWQEH